MLSELWQAVSGLGFKSKNIHFPSGFRFLKNRRVRRCGYLVVFITLVLPPLVLQEQYEFCYKVVQEYIDAFSDYANFK